MRSPPCSGRGGSTGVPSPRNDPGVCGSPTPDAIASNTFSSSPPRKIEMIAGGASFAPRRWSWPMAATDARTRPWCLLTAWITAAQKNRKLMFSDGLSPGSSRFPPVSVPMDQLLCLPEPFTPANGFSCSRHTRPYLRATLIMNCMVSCWWSEPTFEFSNTGASSYWPGRHLVVAGLDGHAELRELELRPPSCRRARARGSTRSSGRPARGPWAAGPRTASGPWSPGRGARSSTARRSGSTPAPARPW